MLHFLVNSFQQVFFHKYCIFLHFLVCNTQWVCLCCKFWHFLVFSIHFFLCVFMLSIFTLFVFSTNWSVFMFILYMFTLFVFSTNRSVFMFMLYMFTLFVFSTNRSVFSSPGPRTKGPGELLPSLGVRRLSSVNFSHFKLLLRNHLADWNQT